MTKYDYIPGQGPSNATIMLVGESPGKHEFESGYPFAGPSGDLLDEILKSVELRREEVYITNVFKRAQFDGVKLRHLTELQKSEIDQLWEEILSMTPNVIVALGAVPLHILTGKIGITNYRGSILISQRYGKIVVPTYNPAHLLYMQGGEVSAYWQKYVISFDLDKAKRFRYQQTWSPPTRNLRVARSSLDVWRFIDRNRDNPIVSVDIETIKTAPVCVGLAFTKHEALSIPLFQTLAGIKVSTIPYNDLAEIWTLVAQTLKSKRMVGQNFKFDQERLEWAGFQVGPLQADTMLMAHTLYPELPKSLAFLASIHTDEPYYKDEGKEFNPKKDNIDQLFLYNAKDAAVTMEVYEALKKELEDEGLDKFYFDYINHLHDLYRGVEAIGLRIDPAARNALRAKYRAWLEDINIKLEKLCGYKPNVNSPKQIAIMLFDSWGFPRRADVGEDTLVALMANHAKTRDKKELLQLIIDGRRVRKILGTYIDAKPDYDGRMRTQYRITGTETGRTSTSVLRPPVRPEQLGLAFQTMSKHGSVGKDLRTMFVPDDGYVFVNFDLSQAEARIVALLANDYDLAILFDTVDIHRFTAAIAFDYPITKKYNSAGSVLRNSAEVREAIAAITSDERFIGKFVRHGGNYDMGKHRFMIEVNTAAKRFGVDVQVSEWKAGQLLERFHEFTPNIRGVFHQEVKYHLGQSRTLTNPFGRRRMFYDRWAPDLFKEAYAFLPQSTVADKMKTSMLKLKQAMSDLQILVEAHDSNLLQIKEDEVADRIKAIRAIVETPISFEQCSLKRTELVIPCDFEIGTNYAELKKLAK